MVDVGGDVLVLQDVRLNRGEVLGRDEARRWWSRRCGDVEERRERRQTRRDGEVGRRWRAKLYPDGDGVFDSRRVVAISRHSALCRRPRTRPRPGLPLETKRASGRRQEGWRAGEGVEHSGRTGERAERMLVAVRAMAPVRYAYEEGEAMLRLP